MIIVKNAILLVKHVIRRDASLVLLIELDRMLKIYVLVLVVEAQQLKLHIVAPAVWGCL
jgi:hypothetical protein